LIAEGRQPKKQRKQDLTFAIEFSKFMGEEMVTALNASFPGIRSGEIPSMSFRGLKRIDVVYSTPEAGLSLGISFKSVHKGEKKNGDADFTHNMKRNDEELRVEATGHHIRQPYAVMVAFIFLPLEACADGETSSFAQWVEYLWPLKGREEPEDAPDLFELVYIGVYARDGSALGLYEVGGDVPCPRTGTPKFVSLDDFVSKLKAMHARRNGLDFHFEGEAPQ
jgi:hypothetical protein